MKKIGIYLLAAASTLGASAAPLASIGDKVDVFFTAALTEKFNSNLYASAEDEVDDYVTTLRFGLAAEYGRDAKFNANIGIYEDLVFYAREDHLDNDLFSMYANASYAGDRYDAAFAFTYAQLQQNSSTIGGYDDVTDTYIADLVRYDSFSASLRNNYDLTAKVFLELNTFYTGQYFKDYTNIYSDSEVYTIPLSVLYKVTDKVSAGVTLQYRLSNFEGGSSESDVYGDSREDYFMGLTLRGDLTTKLNAKIYFGGTYRVLHGVAEGYDSNELAMAMNMAFDYILTDKIGTYMVISRDFGNGSSRQNILSTGVNLGCRYRFSDFVSMAASFSYTNSEYENDSNRKDNEFIPNISLTYAPIQNLSFSIAYNYIYNESNEDASEYYRHLFTLSGTFRY